MKTKLLISILLMYATIIGAQKKADSAKINQKFYFPTTSFSNPKEFDKNFTNVVSKIATLEINEKTKKFSYDADLTYLLQKNYKGLIDYSKNENFPKSKLPLKSYAEAMIADPTQGNVFKKTFIDHFSKDFNPLNGRTKTSIANQYFDEKILNEYQKNGKEFRERLAKSKSDSISNDDAKTLMYYENLKIIVNTILPIGKNVVKDYVLEEIQPYITGAVWLSVVKPKEVNDFPDLTKDYKIVFELIEFGDKDDKENAIKNENSPLIEAGRIINLHIASGIPPEKLKIVFVVHGAAIDILLKNEVYKESHKVDNPNLSLIKQMQSKGAKFVVCGQLMTWIGLKLADLTENVKEAYSAKTALSNYQTQGYVLYKLQQKD